MEGKIELRCPRCNRKPEMIDREPTDYPEAVRIEIVCMTCDDGESSETFQYDADGNHITRDPTQKEPK